MDNFKLVITNDMLKEGIVPFSLITLTSLVIIIITTILVQKRLKGVIKNEKN